MDAEEVVDWVLVNATSFLPLMGGGGLPFNVSGTLPLACRWRRLPFADLRAIVLRKGKECAAALYLCGWPGREKNRRKASGNLEDDTPAENSTQMTRKSSMVMCWPSC